MALGSFDFAVQGDPADSSERYTFTMGPSSLRMLIARRTQVSVPPPWPERAGDWLPDSFTLIHIELLGQDKRAVTIRPVPDTDP